MLETKYFNVFFQAQKWSKNNFIIVILWALKPQKVSKKISQKPPFSDEKITYFLPLEEILSQIVSKYFKNCKKGLKKEIYMQ